MTGSLHPENCTIFSVLLTRVKYVSEQIDLNYLGDIVKRRWKITKEEMCGRNTMREDFPRRFPMM